MQSKSSIGRLYGQLGSVLRVFVTGSTLIFAGCSGDDAAQAPSPSTTQSTLNSTVMALPIESSPMERVVRISITRQ